MKKHLVFLGNLGVIYYSWFFCLLFLAIIFCLEGSQFVNPPMVVTFFLFGLLLIYTWLTSFVSLGEKMELHLPFRRAIVLEKKPSLVGSWKCFAVYRAKISRHHSLDYLVISRKRDKND
ncbi:G6EU66 (Putative uncharacterized protein) [Lactobacillus equicursoris 66c]|uniref:Uncharacterized protein n=1 Tax=Lactobacillus equicursoris 66c TaxID=872326 RepID=K0NG17_9LACO|nr:hypothetical protein [Lactobacillus equicursoris]CCK84232.1 G6EU66 (Putative uncharacterized protein) [Lactobacillus equicursoris 66c]